MNMTSISNFILLSGILILFANGLFCERLEAGQDGQLSTSVRISGFNIQTFGRAKMDNPFVAQALVVILKRYDIVLIQEIRDVTGTAIKALLENLNQESSDTYRMAISPRLGRSSYKEQYAYFYKTSTVRLLDTYQYDPDYDEDYFQRPPYIARFSLTTGLRDFFLVGIHVQPSNAVAEIDALTSVYDHVREKWNVEDGVLLGDFNAGCDYVTGSDWPNISLRTQKRFSWLIGDDVRTNLGFKPCPYDRIVVVGNTIQKAVVAGSAIAYRFDEEMDLELDQAKLVSDHFPVEFQLRV